MTTRHTPVLLAEVIKYLNLKPNGKYVDATIGGGGHTRAILEAQPDSVVLGIDRDPNAIARASQLLKPYGQRVLLKSGSYEELPDWLSQINWRAVDGIIMDLGLSSDQLDDSMRGFSFQRSGPLDLRFNPNEGLSTTELIGRWSEAELGDILGEYGELRRPRQLATRIKSALKNGLTTTEDLIRATGLAHPRRKAQLFQALRIATNDEFRILCRSLPHLWQLLSPSGRLVVITFHSLEDRIVKHQFLEWRRLKEGLILTKKPIRPTEDEIKDNPRSRSAKMRAIQKEKDLNI